MNNTTILNRISKIEDAITVLQMELTTFKAELREPEQNDTRSMLISCGFLVPEDLNGREEKTIISFIENTISKQLTAEEIEKTARKIADINKKKPVNNKFSYLIKSLKNKANDKEQGAKV